MSKKFWFLLKKNRNHRLKIHITSVKFFMHFCQRTLETSPFFSVFFNVLALAKAINLLHDKTCKCNKDI